MLRASRHRPAIFDAAPRIGLSLVRAGSGTIMWQSRENLAAGKINYDEFMEIVASSAPSIGHCNTMGTATTMNSLAEALGMSLPGCAAIPAPHRDRQETPGEDEREAAAKTGFHWSR